MFKRKPVAGLSTGRPEGQYLDGKNSVLYIKMYFLLRELTTIIQKIILRILEYLGLQY